MALNPDSLAATCSAYGIAINPDTLAADTAQLELIAELEAELRSIRTETDPDAAAITSGKELRKALDLLVRKESRAAREAFVRAAIKNAQAARVDIWTATARDMLDTSLRRPFDELGATLTEAAMRMPNTSPQSAAEGHGAEHDKIRECAGRLAILRGLRVTLARAVDAPTPPDSCPAITDVVHVDDHDAHGRAVRATSGIAIDSPAWWVALARTPGVRIEWHSVSEQVERYSRIRSKTPATTTAA